MSTPEHEHEIDAAYLAGRRDVCRRRGHVYTKFEYSELEGKLAPEQMVIATCKWCAHQRAVWLRRPGESGPKDYHGFQEEPTNEAMGAVEALGRYQDTRTAFTDEGRKA